MAELNSLAQDKLMTHVKYKQKFGRQMDFLVRYSRVHGSELLIPKLLQDMRFDFSYKDSQSGNNYMIWPEFMMENGEIIGGGFN